MAKKRAIIGFKGLALAPVTEDSIIAYESQAAEPLPYAGTMSRTPKESTQDLYYDDDLYAQIKDISGDDVEIRLAEMSLSDIAKYGLGTYDTLTRTLEADFNAKGEVYALRCICDTVDHLPYYFNYRVFEISNIRFDNFQTKGSSLSVCEVIVSGVFKRPKLPGLTPFAITCEAEDGANRDACLAFISQGEAFPK
jgi:hypothetical protein